MLVGFACGHFEIPLVLFRGEYAGSEICEGAEHVVCFVKVDEYLFI